MIILSYTDFLSSRHSQVSITKNCDIDDAKEETHPFVARVGFSLDESNLLLGEEKFSYGYGGWNCFDEIVNRKTSHQLIALNQDLSEEHGCAESIKTTIWSYFISPGTGKMSSELKFRDYGTQFGQGDVVGCYIDYPHGGINTNMETLLGDRC